MAHLRSVPLIGAGLPVLTGSFALATSAPLGGFVLLLSYAFRRGARKRVGATPRVDS